MPWGRPGGVRGAFGRGVGKGHAAIKLLGGDGVAFWRASGTLVRPLGPILASKLRPGGDFPSLFFRHGFFINFSLILDGFGVDLGMDFTWFFDVV